MSFYAIRFLLGFAEAGFFPGIVYYFGDWYPERQRARAIASFMAAVPLSSAIGGPLGGALLSFSGQFGLAGWQWLFLVEGVPSVLLGLVVFFFLTDRPQDAGWLTTDQREWLCGKLERERHARVSSSEGNLLRALGSWTLWRLTGAYLLGLCAWLGALYFAPVLVRDGLHIGNAMVGLAIGGFGMVGLVAMLANGAHSDKTGERVVHTALPMLVVACGFVLAALVPAPSALLAALALIYLGSNAFLPVFWCVPTALLRGTAAAGGIAVINSIGNLGGFFAPSLLGALKDRTGSFTSGLLTLGVLAISSALVVLSFRGKSTPR
jgi:ACS family tartrate transporter-like MFS transporter